MTVNVLYKTLFISWPSSAKQEREMIKFCAFWRTQTAAANFPGFNLEFDASSTNLA